MGTTKVYSPNAAFRGRVGGVQFDGGVASVDLETNPSAARYFERRGYGIGQRADNPVLPYDKLEPTDVDGNVIDARDYGEKRPFGTPLRDAAVDPHPEDFLPPTNAGEANPHGPKVVSPEVHASGPAGIRAGEVHVDDTGKQQAAETKLAEAVLVDGVLATDQAVEFDGTPKTGNMGPLGLSDPGSVELGKQAAGDQPATDAGPPTRRAVVADWRAYAESQGLSADEAADLSKGELIERYG